MIKRNVEMDDKFAVVTVFREDFLKREYEFNSPACVVYNDKYFKVRQKVFSFLYRNNFFNPKLSYVYLVDEDNFMCTKVVVNMSQMFREKGILYALLERTFKDNDCQVFKDIFEQYAPYSTLS